MLNWVLAWDVSFSYHNTEAILFTIDPYYGIALDEVPEQEPSKVSEDPAKQVKLDYITLTTV